MRLVVTGAGGQLGRGVVTAAERAGHMVVGLQRAECDIACRGAAAASINAHRPDAVINCAAWTRVDAAESEPKAAYRDNTKGPALLASACQEAGVLLCHVSTDFVFDGRGTVPLDETTAPAPLSVYGESKLGGEEEVRRRCTSHQIVRTSWLFGGQGPNFVLTVLRLASERHVVRIVADQVGSPTWTGHLAPAMVRLVERAEPGIYHLTGAGRTSWHGLAERIVAEAGLTGARLEPITTAEYPTAAERPKNSVLDNRAWRLLGEAPLPPWEDGLRGYLAEVRSGATGA